MLAEIWKDVISGKDCGFYVPIFKSQVNTYGIAWLATNGAVTSRQYFRDTNNIFNSLRWAKAELCRKFIIIKEVKKTDNDRCIACYEILVRFN